MLHPRTVCSYLVVSLSISTCMAQVPTYNSQSPTYSTRASGQDEAMLYRKAQGGDGYAAYLLGKLFETGNGSLRGRVNLSAAISWYNQAVQRNNLNAIYRLGKLEALGIAQIPQKNGSYEPDPAQGNAMMRYALSRGYSPQTDTVNETTNTSPARPATQAPRSSSSSSSASDGAAVAVGLGLLALFAIAASGSSTSNDSSKSASSNSSTVDSVYSKTCTIFYDVPITPNPTYPGTTTEQHSRTGYGYECP